MEHEFIVKFLTFNSSTFSLKNTVLIYFEQLAVLLAFDVAQGFCFDLGDF